MVRAAVGQICATGSVKANLDQCVRLVASAAAGGAKVRHAGHARAALLLPVPSPRRRMCSGSRPIEIRTAV
ncbi:hypothetical protein CDD83_7947 [Cordyceps sp. RAO-2017]|nr:hypothetical protein CDD83_7947 [Cordyceps sp. RAO-2017]